MAMKWTEKLMQDALVSAGNLFDYHDYAVVPNVSWAVLSNGEADLLCLSRSGTFHEVEIKVSRADIKADAKKWHGHEDLLVQYTWFAVPVELEDDAKTLVPERFGIVVVESAPNPARGTYLADRYTTRVVRKAKQYRPHGWQKPSDAVIIKFLRTGVLRMWTKRRKVGT